MIIYFFLSCQIAINQQEFITFWREVAVDLYLAMAAAALLDLLNGL